MERPNDVTAWMQVAEAEGQVHDCPDEWSAATAAYVRRLEILREQAAHYCEAPSLGALQVLSAVLRALDADAKR